MPRKNYSMNKRCSIVIVTFNQLDYTRECINSILEGTSYPFRILIVDNGSNKESIDYFNNIREKNIAAVIFNRENSGWVRGVNQGLSASQDSYVCVMNNDTLVYPDWLTEMVSVSERDESIGIVNPLWEIPSSFKGGGENYFEKVIKKQKGEIVETDWIRGFCFLIKRKVIDSIGYLGEEFSPGYYDDWDYSVRAIQAGFRCVRAKGAFVYHYKNVTANRTLKDSGINMALSEKSKIFYKKWGKPLRILFVVDASFKNLSFLEDITLQLLRNQNKLVVLSNQNELVIEHTNCILKSSRYFLIIRALANLINDFRHSNSKRYNVIICSANISNILRKFNFIKDNYFIREINDLISEKEVARDIEALKKFG